MFVFDFSVSDADGQMKVEEISTNPLVQDLLNHEVNQYNPDPLNPLFIFIKTRFRL